MPSYSILVAGSTTFRENYTGFTLITAFFTGAFVGVEIVQTTAIRSLSSVKTVFYTFKTVISLILTCFTGGNALTAVGGSSFEVSVFTETIGQFLVSS